MNRKQKFMEAVRLLAPGDQFTIRAAQRVREETLPTAPGGAALEFVAAMEKVKNSDLHRITTGQALPRRQKRPSAALRRLRQETDRAATEGASLPMQHALLVKSAEFWLKLSQPAQAFMELDRLPEDVRKHPWALRVFLSAMRLAWEMSEYPAHAE